jgi:hypothetical protein
VPFLNRCIWNASGTSSSAFVVATAAQGGYTPAECLDPTVADESTYHYSATDSAGNHQEGDGTYSVATGTLTSTLIRNSSNSGAAVTFTSPPVVIMGGPNANDVLSIATENMSWFVDGAHGSDTNSGLAVGTLNTNAATATTSAVLDFAATASVPIVAGMSVFDTTTSRYVGAVMSVTGTTVTLTANALYAVGSGDTLQFTSSFQTIARAVAVANTFNYQGLFFPTIRIADGTYTNVQQVLPPLFNTIGNNGGVIQGNFANEIINTSAATPTSSAVLTFAAAVGVEPGMIAIDNSFSGGAGGFIGTVASVSGGTVTLTANSKIAVASGDQIIFTPLGGVNVADGGSDYTFILPTFSSWTITGINFTGTFGGIFLNPFSQVFIPNNLNFGGELTGGSGIFNGLASVDAFGAILTVTSSEMHSLFLVSGLTDCDEAYCVFVNPITFTGSVMSMDDRYGFFGGFEFAFLNGANVTVSGGVSLQMTDGAYFETSATFVDAVPMSRANFPGFAAGFQIDSTSFFGGDVGYQYDSNFGLFWRNATGGVGAADTGISKVSPGVLAVGNGTQGDTSATVEAASFLGTKATGGVGYAKSLGVGGTVTQATSKSTGVTLSKLSGQITMNAAALAASTTVSFTLTNTTLAAGDIIVLNHVSGGTAGSYTLNAQVSGSGGSASINVRNVSLASLSEAIVIGFAVIKGSTN